MKLTRHNGRAGKNGVYNPKHNDRRFDVANSEHIDSGRTKQNIYWDCYTGFSSELSRERGGEKDFSFERIEKLYYFDHYHDHIQAQNERNEKTRHTERNRTVEDLLASNRICPEESIYQIGTVEGSVSGELLARIAAEFFAEMEERFGAHVHILDWALHLDEGTPHIHERHVFDCKNKYGELCPQQEKALEELGVTLPDPDKKKGRNNNRKQTFDAECRGMLFRICARHGLHLETEPSHGGRGYMEKQDFIIEKQKETLLAQREISEQNARAMEEQERKLKKTEKAFLEKQKELKKQDEILAEKNRELSGKQAALATVTMKLADMESLAGEVADTAYEKACQVVADTVRAETQKEDLRALEDFKEWLSAPERKAPQDKREFAVKCLETVQGQIKDMAQKALKKVQAALHKPEVSRANREQVREKAKESIREQLARGKMEADRLNR
ncbi:MAG: serine/arginine repetitive matrix protein 2, partial [Blautia sp.]|nr:serine/arginine repetitive matrix protein 2 [Blautia sp.]